MNDELLFAMIKAHNSGVDIDKFDLDKLVSNNGLEETVLFFKSIGEKEAERGMPKLKVKRKINEPINDLGSRIELILTSGNRKLNSEEEMDTHIYFCHDFDRCLDWLYQCTENADKDFPKAKKYVKDAEEMMQRAFSDFEMIPRVDPDGHFYVVNGNSTNTVPESERMNDELQAAKKELSRIGSKYAWFAEDPRWYWRGEMKKAADAEDFERAASIKALIAEHTHSEDYDPFEPQYWRT